MTVNLARLEAEIALPEPVRHYAHPRHRQPPLPEYITHKEGVEQLGRMTAEAVVLQYEQAAKEVEAMGAEMKRVVARCEEIIASAHTAMQQAQETATAYREDAKKIFDKLEEHAILTQDVVKTCQAMRDRLAEGTA